MHDCLLPKMGMHVMMMRGDADDLGPLAGVSAEHWTYYTYEKECVNSLTQ